MEEETPIIPTDAGTDGMKNENGTPDVTPPPVENPSAQGSEAPANPFDFTQIGQVADSASAEDGDSGDYSLDFGSAFTGSDEIRSMITGHAQQAGISAKAGSAFVGAVCHSLLEAQQKKGMADYESLEKEWGSAFESNLQNTKAVMGQLFSSGVIRQEDAPELMTPAVFRLVNHMRTKMGENPALGVNKPSTTDGRAEYQRIMSNPKSAEFQILMNPQHPQYKETAARMNSLAGMTLH